MKNKGRKHKAGHNSTLAGIGDCKGGLVWLTRPITQIGSRTGKDISWKVSKFDKRSWSKRVRGYFKSQTKEILE